MKHVLLIILTSIGLLCCLISSTQDSLYAKSIDSLFTHSYTLKQLRKSKISGNATLSYSYYRNTHKIRTLVSLNKAEKENLLIFYFDDKPVMISPSGQEPYYILNDKIVYAKQLQHTSEQLEELITKAYKYLEYGYKILVNKRY